MTTRLKETLVFFAWMALLLPAILLAVFIAIPTRREYVAHRLQENSR